MILESVYKFLYSVDVILFALSIFFVLMLVKAKENLIVTIPYILYLALITYISFGNLSNSESTFLKLIQNIHFTAGIFAITYILYLFIKGIDHAEMIFYTFISLFAYLAFYSFTNYFFL